MKVLIVDDQKAMRLISSAVVEGMGHEAFEVDNGNAAITACNENVFDLVLMDVEMPGISGFEAARAIREQNSAWFPIIFISAKTDPKFFVEGIQSGGDIYLHKPIVPEVLESMINAMARIANFQEELHDAKLKMEALAHRDQLTGIMNRRGFDNAAALAFDHAQKTKSPVSIILLDVDKFKPFNDNRGHQEGDRCLKKVAEILETTLHRPQDVVARYGGEEFVVILPHTDAAGARVVGQRVIDAFAAAAYPHGYSEIADHVTVSGGVADITEKDNVQQMIKFADEQLYAAKAQGRNQIL